WDYKPRPKSDIIGSMEHPGDTRGTWLSVQQAARAYGVSRRTIQRRLAAGDLDGFVEDGPLGARWRIRPPANGHGPAAPPATAAARSPAVVLLAPSAAPLSRPRAGDGSGERPTISPPRAGEGLGERSVAALLDRLVDALLAERDSLRPELTQAQDARRADAAELARLRAHLDAAQAELARLRAPLPPPR